MTRAYPPNWCKEEDCKKCDFISCDNKILKIFSKQRDKKLNKNNIDTTVAGIYLTYCERLAKFFMQFPINFPIHVVYDNFLFSETRKPAETNIQRILLDMLNKGNPEAPTDEVHEIRLILFEQNEKVRTGKLMAGNNEIPRKFKLDERDKMINKTNEFISNYKKGNITYFNKTDDLNKCKYCFLKNCELI